MLRSNPSAAKTESRRAVPRNGTARSFSTQTAILPKRKNLTQQPKKKMLHSILLKYGTGSKAFDALTLATSTAAGAEASSNTDAALIAAATSIILLLIKELVKAYQRKK